MDMLTFYNCESVGNSIAIRKESNGNIIFLGKRAHFRLETESWKALKRQVAATDRTDDFLSITSDPTTKSTYFHLGTVWPQVTTTNSREDMFQLEITVLQFCIDKILTSYLDLKMLNEVFGRVPWPATLLSRRMNLST